MEPNYTAAERLIVQEKYEEFFRMMDDERARDDEDNKFLLNMETRVHRALKRRQLETQETSSNDAALNKINDSLFEWLRKKLIQDNPKIFSHPEKLITGKIKPVHWLEKALEKTKSVCRITIGKDHGTGTIINGKYLLTCHHVIRSNEDAADAILQFNYVEGTRADDIPEYKVEALVCTDASLDFSVCTIEEKAQKYLSHIPPVILKRQHLKFVEDVQIIQHPNGKFMQIALIDSKLTGTEGHRIFYTSDTDSGSSGAAVFNDKWEIIGVHTSSTSKKVNAGTYINFILDRLEAENIPH